MGTGGKGGANGSNGVPSAATMHFRVMCHRLLATRPFATMFAGNWNGVGPAGRDLGRDLGKDLRYAARPDATDLPERRPEERAAARRVDRGARR